MNDTAARVVTALKDRGLTLGVAESLTGGAVTAALVSVPGASAVLLGGVVAYATPVKHTLLGVDAALLARSGAVHPDVAAQMAQGARRAVAVDGRAADVGISTTGIAGPGSPDGQPVGTVHIGFSMGDGRRSAGFRFAGDRETVRVRAVAAALAVLLQGLGE